MDFLSDAERDSSLILPTTPRTSLSREEVERQKSKADNITWFTHGEFMWRSGASIVWFLFLLPTLCTVYITVASFSILHPINWITELVSNLFSLWSLFVYIFVFGTAMMPVVLTNMKICSVEIRIGLTRIAAVASFFTVKHICHLVLCTLTGSVGSWWISSLNSPYANYGRFIQNCSNPCDGKSSACLNEVSLFLIVLGAILGVLYSILFFKEKHHQISFPVVQQERIFRVKACLVPCFWQAVIICLKSIQICYPLYFLFGFLAKRIVFVITGLETDRQLQPLDSLYGLLDVALFWFCFTTTTLLAFVWILANKLFIIFNTEVLRFPIQATFTMDSGQSLPVALKCQTVPLLKYLAFNDLCQLSQFSAKRRKQIFSLSIPGGRPLNWLWVSDECLILLNELKERIKLVTQSNHVFSTRKLTDSGRRTPSRTLTDLKDSHSSARNTSSNAYVRNHNKDSKSVADSQSKNDTRSGDHLTVRNQPKNKPFMDKVKRLPVMNYFLEKREDIEMEDLFYDTQLQIWAAEGLSRLVAASYKEDIFGVVQKTLPFILSSLLELLQAVEIFLKRPPSQQQLFRVRHPSDIRKTVHVLRDSLRCSVYRITETFQQHLSDVELTATNKEFLKSFLEFQE